MEKTLKIIQTLAKIAKVCAKIAYICSIVSICICAVGVVMLALGGETLKLGGVSIHTILSDHAGISESTVLATMLAGIALCTGELVLSYRAHIYFTHELEAGTPFTRDGSIELRRLGIAQLWIPVVSYAVAITIREVIEQVMGEVAELGLESWSGVSTGITLILISLLCAYGAEVVANGKGNESGET